MIDRMGGRERVKEKKEAEMIQEKKQTLHTVEAKQQRMERENLHIQAVIVNQVGLEANHGVARGHAADQTDHEATVQVRVQAQMNKKVIQDQEVGVGVGVEAGLAPTRV